MTSANRLTAGLAAAAVIILAAGGCYAAGNKLSVGDAAPAWSDITGIDDQKHALADYKDAKLLVLVFTTNHCPVAQAYQDRLIAVQKDYQPKGVQIVAVNVNTIEQDRLPAMKQRAKDKGFNFPYLYDATQKIGHDYGTRSRRTSSSWTRTARSPTWARSDDNMNADKVKTRYLRDAVDALLAGKAPPRAVTTQFGCGIRYQGAENKGDGGKGK